MQKIIAKSWKKMIKIKNRHIFNINLYGWAMSQKLPVNDFGWIKDTSRFNEDFIKTYNERSDEGYYFQVNDVYPKKITWIS